AQESVDVLVQGLRNPFVLPVANQRRLGLPLFHHWRFSPRQKAAPGTPGLRFDCRVTENIDDMTPGDEFARQSDLRWNCASTFPHAEQKVSLGHWRLGEIR